MEVLEVENNKIEKKVFKGKGYLLKDRTHLIISKIYDNYISVINSYTNSNFIFKEDVWKEIEYFPAELYDKLKKLHSPSYKSSFPNNNVEKVVSFIIVMSYACNMRCTYCYQQINKELNRQPMKAETLENILKTIHEFKMNHTDKIIQIGLFGGEPLMEENHDLIIKIFDFCVENSISVSITTNGRKLEFYLKDLIIYRALHITLCTTIDSISNNSATRHPIKNRYDKENVGSEKLLSELKILINNGVYVSVETNIDRHNINQINEIISYYENNEFIDNPYFYYGFGRVDDRLYETNYPDIVSYVDILFELAKIGDITPHFFISFLRTSYELSKKIGLNYNQQELKYSNSYCWASSSLDKAYYIDSDMNTYRCTYTVGRPEYSVMKFSTQNLEEFTIPYISFDKYEKCQKCKIGGYCAGGCMLSAKANFERQCDDEKAEFDKYLDLIYYPTIKKMLFEYLKCNN